MKISDIPFRKLAPNDIARMWLPVTIMNPDTKNNIKVFGLIDTGADECALPAIYATRLGHNLQAGYVPLLGVKSFLSHFILTVDYPRQVFSLEIPE